MFSKKGSICILVFNMFLVMTVAFFIAHNKYESPGKVAVILLFNALYLGVLVKILFDVVATDKVKSIDQYKYIRLTENVFIVGSESMFRKTLVLWCETKLKPYTDVSGLTKLLLDAPMDTLGVCIKSPPTDYPALVTFSAPLIGATPQMVCCTAIPIDVVKLAINGRVVL